MRWRLFLLVALATWFSSFLPATAGAVKRVQTSTMVNTTSARTDTNTVNQTFNQTNYNTVDYTINNFSSEVHRIVTGAVAKGLQDHTFLSKPYDAAESFDAYGNKVASDFGGRSDGGALLRLNVLTPGEESFLSTVNKYNADGQGGFFSPNTQFFYDLTTQTFPSQAACFGTFGNDIGSAIATEENNFFTDPRFQPQTTTASSTATSVSATTSSTTDTSQQVSNSTETDTSVSVANTNVGVFNFAQNVTTTIDTVNVTTVTTVNTTVNTTDVTTTNVTTNDTNTVSYQLVAAVYNTSPLVLDLRGDQQIEVSFHYWLPHAPKFYTQNARMFDINGTGVPVLTEWFTQGPRDGFLCKPENGTVTSALQLFGTAGGYKDGYEKLSLLDKNHNGWIEGEELDGLMIWIDANNDGKCEPGELHPLSEFGITRIACTHSNYVSRYETADGKSHMMWDWWPAVMETRKFHASAQR